MVFTIIILVVFVLFLIWNATLVGYKDKPTEPIDTNPERCFCPEARPIVCVHDKKSDRAIIMVHGFPSTPRVYSYSSKRMHESGFDVFAPLLPGFGTTPQDFYKTHFTTWFEYLQAYYLDIRSRYSHVFVLGTSMGGSLTLKLAEVYSNSQNAPDAIITIGAPVVYNSLLKDGIVTNPAMYIGRTVASIVPAIKPAVTCGNTHGEDGFEDWTGYKGIYVRQGISFIAGLKSIRKNLSTISVPLFAIHDKHDKTISVKNLGIISREATGSKKRILETEMPLFNHTKHALLMYHSVQQELTDAIILYCNDIVLHKGVQ